MIFYYVYCILAPWIVLRDPADYDDDADLFTSRKTEYAWFETHEAADAWRKVLDLPSHRRGRVCLTVGAVNVGHD